MPDELTINGVAYVRADRRQKPFDTIHYCKVSELAKEFRIDRHHIDRALNSGELTYSLMNGCTKPKYVLREKFIEWLKSKERSA